MVRGQGRGRGRGSRAGAVSHSMSSPIIDQEQESQLPTPSDGPSRVAVSEQALDLDPHGTNSAVSITANKQKRGNTKCTKFAKLIGNGLIPLEIVAGAQGPTGDNANVFVERVTYIVRNFANLKYSSCLKVPPEHKTELYDRILEKSKRNKVNGSKLKVNHTTGSKSIIRRQNELKIQNEEEATSLVDFYKISHTKNDGSFVTPAIEENYSNMKDLFSQEEVGSIEEQIFNSICVGDESIGGSEVEWEEEAFKRERDILKREQEHDMVGGGVGGTARPTAKQCSLYALLRPSIASLHQQSQFNYLTVRPQADSEGLILYRGCNKITSKEVMLDEIINYVQSLQLQVECLSMKLTTVNPRLHFNIESLLSKDDLFMKSTMDSIFKVGFGVELDNMGGSSETTKFANAFDESSELTLWHYVDIIWLIKKFLNVVYEAKLRKNIKVIDDFLCKLICNKIKQNQNSTNKDSIKKRTSYVGF